MEKRAGENDRPALGVAVAGGALRESATVVALDGDGVWVETQRQGTCHACSASKACGQGLMNRLMPGRGHYVRALRARGPNSAET